ncbi:hypothetical protein GC194_08825 [bacterium]|nr:hypothetical protein [bacterium]
MDDQKNELLLELKRDLEFYKEAIQTIAYEIIDNDVSKYPVFVAHKTEVDLGRKILDAEELEAKWDINASILEEFVAKGLIPEEKTKSFTAAFKNPKTHMCVFVADERSGNFVFFPY